MLPKLSTTLKDKLSNTTSLSIDPVSTEPKKQQEQQEQSRSQQILFYLHLVGKKPVTTDKDIVYTTSVGGGWTESERRGFFKYESHNSLANYSESKKEYKFWWLGHLNVSNNWLFFSRRINDYVFPTKKARDHYIKTLLKTGVDEKGRVIGTLFDFSEITDILVVRKNEQDYYEKKKIVILITNSDLCETPIAVYGK